MSTDVSQVGSSTSANLTSFFTVIIIISFRLYFFPWAKFIEEGKEGEFIFPEMFSSPFMPRLLKHTHGLPQSYSGLVQLQEEPALRLISLLHQF